MQTRSLRTLLEISRSGSFLAAAHRLGMTLSAVSMQMKALESELDAALFDRTFRPPQLTPLGSAVCAQAQALVDAERKLVELCQQNETLKGHYRIGFIGTASVRLLPDFLINAKRLAPDAVFEIETGLSEALEERVLSGLLDAAIVTATSTHSPDLDYKILRQEPLAYVAPEPFADFSPEELIEQTPFFHFIPHSGIGKLIASHVESFKNRGRKSIVLDSVEAIMECVNKGLGFTLLPEPDIARFLTNQAKILPSPNPGLSRHLVLAHRRQPESNPHTSTIKAINQMLSD